MLPALWIYTNAKERGKDSRSALSWAFWTFFLGIIVIPLWFWIRPKGDSEGARLCPKCKEVLIRDPIYCPTCGLFLKDEVVDLTKMELDVDLSDEKDK